MTPGLGTQDPLTRWYDRAIHCYYGINGDWIVLLRAVHIDGGILRCACCCLLCVVVYSFPSACAVTQVVVEISMAVGVVMLRV